MSATPRQKVWVITLAYHGTRSVWAVHDTLEAAQQAAAHHAHPRAPRHLSWARDWSEDLGDYRPYEATCREFAYTIESFELQTALESDSHVSPPAQREGRAVTTSPFDRPYDQAPNHSTDGAG